jgi:hypothetical protein
MPGAYFVDVGLRSIWRSEARVEGVAKAIAMMAFAFVLTAHAGEPARANLAGVWSDLHFNAEGGDLLGMELFFVPRSGNRYSVLVQVAEGEFPETALLTTRMNGAHFELAFASRHGPFQGQIVTCQVEAKAIRCQWPSGQVDRLRLGKSYWQGR